MLATEKSDFVVICLRNSQSDEVLIDIFLFHRLLSYFWNFFSRAARKPEGKHMTIDEATVSLTRCCLPCYSFLPKFYSKLGNQGGSLSWAEHLVKIISVKDWNDGLKDYVCLSTKFQPTFRDSI